MVCELRDQARGINLNIISEHTWGIHEPHDHQEIVKIHIRHYEPPKCIVDGRLRYELGTIL